MRRLNLSLNLSCAFRSQHSPSTPLPPAGESYAGHNVPAVASRVFRAAKAGETAIPLAGFAIGNGLVDPAIQYGAYLDFAVQNDLLSPSVRDAAMTLYPACKTALEACDAASWDAECVAAVEFCQVTMFGPVLVANPGINVYEYRKLCEVRAPRFLYCTLYFNKKQSTSTFSSRLLFY